MDSTPQQTPDSSVSSALLGPPQQTPDVPAPTPQQAGITPGSMPNVGGPTQTPALGPQHPAVRALKHVGDFIKGYSTEYVPQPDGTVQEVKTKQSTEQFFRGLVVSGLMGAGAGAKSPDFGQGFGAGVENSAKTRQQQDAQKQQFAEKNAQAQVQNQKLDMERQRQKAELAEMNLRDYQAIDNFHATQEETIGKRNSLQDQMRDQIVQQGGHLVPIVVDGQDINATPDNGAKLEQFLHQNPRFLDAPDGSGNHRIQIDRTDSSGLTKGEFGQWVDKATGKDVDIHDYVTHSFYDVPEKLWDTKAPAKGSEVAGWFGTTAEKMGIDPDEKFMLSFGDRVGIKQKIAEQHMSDAKLALEKAKVRQAESKAANGGSDGSDDSIVDGMIDGSLDIAKVASIRNNDRKRLVALAKQKDPSFNMNTYAQRLQTSKYFSPGGKGNDQIVALNTFAGHIGEANEGIQSLRNTNNQLVNSTWNSIAEKFGNTAIAPQRATLEAAKDEYLNFLKAGHAPQKEELKIADTLLSTSQTPAQTQQTLRQMTRVVQIRTQSLAFGYQRTMGKQLGGLYAPETLRVFSSFGIQVPQTVTQSSGIQTTGHPQGPSQLGANQGTPNADLIAKHGGQ